MKIPVLLIHCDCVTLHNTLYSTKCTDIEMHIWNVVQNVVRIQQIRNKKDYWSMCFNAHSSHSKQWFNIHWTSLNVDKTKEVRKSVTSINIIVTKLSPVSKGAGDVGGVKVGVMWACRVTWPAEDVRGDKSTRVPRPAASANWLRYCRKQ